ncbi:MAG: metallopeptidase family protein [Actinobacteria bacterium]|nr:metallopeptidase family protein [Actinomycetota bacterium]
MIEMSSAAFDRAVTAGLATIPDELLAAVDNVAIVVEDDSPPDGPELLGLYEGVPLVVRDGWSDAGRLPDRITIFREPILRRCASVDEVEQQVAITVVHEIAHHFGIDDDRLHALGWA